MADRLPWGIHRIHNMFADHRAVSAGLPDGRYVVAIIVPYVGTVWERLRAAWWVFAGRAHAVVWPEAGELEEALYTPTLRALGAKLKD